MKGGFAVIGLIAAVAASVAHGQTPTDEEMLPELVGAERVTSSPATESGSLPSPYLDYISRSPGGVQHLAMFRNGLVVLSLTRGDLQSRKMVMFPAEAITEYETVLSTSRLKEAPRIPGRGSASTLRETIRIYDAEGKAVERTYDPSVMLPADFERQRDLLRELVQIIWQDRDLSSPFADYQPAAGHLLLDHDLNVWTVLRYHEDSKMVELEDERRLTRAFLTLDQLDEAFAGRYSTVAE